MKVNVEPAGSTLGSRTKLARRLPVEVMLREAKSIGSPARPIASVLHSNVMSDDAAAAAQRAEKGRGRGGRRGDRAEGCVVRGVGLGGSFHVSPSKGTGAGRGEAKKAVDAPEKILDWVAS